MRRKGRALAGVLALVVAAATAGATGDSRAASRAAPRLIVLLVVDQMRADYLDRFGPGWEHGLRRLLDQGAVFRQAKYPFFGTLTCAGHATITTGMLPAAHGMMLDGWWDPVADRRIGCTVDASASKIVYGRADAPPAVPGRADADGPAHFAVPTLADELRAQLPVPPRVAAFSLKSRAAVTLAGRHADAIAWFDDGYRWTSSTAYSAQAVPWLDRFIRGRPVERDYGRVWEASDGAGGFSHALEGETDGRPDRRFYAAWVRSPFADEYLVDLAMAAVDALELGRRGGTDYLAVGFSAPDYVGHDAGPDSAQVPALFRRLDRSIGRLLDRLDRAVGAGTYVVALSADHGVAPIPEAIAPLGFDAGRIVRGEMVDRVNAALAPHLGPGRHALAMVHTDLHLAPGVYDRLKADRGAMEAALEAIRSAPGVARVYRREELAGVSGAADPLTRQVAASWFPGRSADLVIVPRPYWYTWTGRADHGTGYDYDTRVPVLLKGPGIRPGAYDGPASPADIAPTLAFLTGVTLAQTHGRVLHEALAPSP